ncbi:MAG: prepilin peptidase [Alphaproteobacteria bacterium]|nr:prepilin peptidase [Alphaproteobacteria bacterium]
MMSALPFLCLLLTLPLLAALTVIDLRVRLLPNNLVLPFALLALPFHGMTNFLYTPALDMAFGTLAGGGMLYAVRMAANHYYKRDTLGLGDVKLMGAAGLWLGLEDTLLAVTIGASAGVLHGLAVALLHKSKTGESISPHNLSIPAGPAFIVGIVLVGLMKFQTLFVFFPLW